MLEVEEIVASAGRDRSTYERARGSTLKVRACAGAFCEPRGGGVFRSLCLVWFVPGEAS